MKKIISLVLTLIMMVSAAAVVANADGMVYVDADFTNMDSFTSQFHAGLFYTDGSGTLFGYTEAKCLQTKGEWYRYDAEIEACLEVDEMSTGDRAFSLWYCNINLECYGRYDGCVYMRFGYDVANQECYLTAPNLSSEEIEDLVPRVPMELEDGEYYTFGISVTDKRIRGFINGELVIDYIDVNDEYLIGRQDEYTYANPHVFWNDNNYITIKDVKIASEGHLYPFPEEDPGVTSENTTASEPSVSENEGTVSTNENAGTTEGTDNGGEDEGEDNTTKVTSETTTAIVTSVVTNEQGETSIVTSIVTEATTTPGAETNNRPAKPGNATTTGDATFVVIAAMVAALGSAIVIKKANER